MPLPSSRPGALESRTLVLLRHGQSLWNRDRRFAGWADIGLSAHGVEQAERAGRLLAARGFRFDVCFTSCLVRATTTLDIVLRAMGSTGVPVHQTWRLNERHYGGLQGLTYWQAVLRYGPLRVLRCQRSLTVAPPPLEPGDPRTAERETRYASLPANSLPLSESLADTRSRVLPCWRDAITPELAAGRRVLVVSHRNTLSVLMTLIENTPEREFSRPRLPTGRPVVYELDAALRPLCRYDLDQRGRLAPATGGGGADVAARCGRA